MVFSSGTAVTIIYGADIIQTTIRNLVLGIVAVYGVYEIMKLQDHAEFLILLLATVFFTVLEWMVYPDTTMKVLYFFVKFLLIYYFIRYCRSHEIKVEMILFYIIMVITVISLVFYFLLHVLNLKNLPGGVEAGYDYPEFYNNPFKIYFGIYNDKTSLDFTKTIMGQDIARLSGPFWEPGIYGIYLSFALFVLLFVKKHKPINAIYFIILMIALALTMSTSGILCAAVIIAIYLLKHTSQRNILIIFFMALVVVALAIVIFNEKMGSSSGNTRMSDITMGLQILGNNLLTGAGFENSAAFTEQWHDLRDNSNGLIKWMYTFGIPGIVIFFYPFIVNLLNETGDERKSETVFFLIMIVWNMTEPITTMTIMQLFMAIVYERAFKSRNFTFELKGYYATDKRTS